MGAITIQIIPRHYTEQPQPDRISEINNVRDYGPIGIRNAKDDRLKIISYEYGPIGIRIVHTNSQSKQPM